MKKLAVSVVCIIAEEHPQERFEKFYFPASKILSEHKNRFDWFNLLGTDSNNHKIVIDVPAHLQSLPLDKLRDFTEITEAVLLKYRFGGITLQELNAEIARLQELKESIQLMLSEEK